MLAFTLRLHIPWGNHLLASHCSVVLGDWWLGSLSSSCNCRVPDTRSVSVMVVAPGLILVCSFSLQWFIVGQLENKMDGLTADCLSDFVIYMIVLGLWIYVWEKRCLFVCFYWTEKVRCRCGIDNWSISKDAMGQLLGGRVGGTSGPRRQAERHRRERKGVFSMLWREKSQPAMWDLALLSWDWRWLSNWS